MKFDINKVTCKDAKPLGKSTDKLYGKMVQDFILYGPKKDQDFTMDITDMVELTVKREYDMKSCVVTGIASNTISYDGTAYVGENKVPVKCHTIRTDLYFELDGKEYVPFNAVFNSCKGVSWFWKEVWGHLIDIYYMTEQALKQM